MKQVSKEKDLEELADLEKPTELNLKCYGSYTSFEN